MPLLLARCEAILNAKITGSISGAVQLRKDILGDFSELFAIDGSAEDEHELDFYEICFNLAFASFRITRLRPALAYENSRKDWPEPSDEIELIDEELDNEVVARISDLKGDATNPEDRVFRKQVYDAIINLPPDQRKAVVLVHLLGYTREAAAGICKVDERTIRNRLKRALAVLLKLKEDA